jgi:DNA polymerase III epsilon subunit family exonuclease
MIDPATPLRLVPFVSIDVETTGLDPRKDQIVELGAVKVLDGKIVDEWGTLVHVKRTIPLGARRVHGISNAMLIGQPPIGDALPPFLQFLGDGALVEHSWKAFDVLFLEQAYGRKLDAPYLNTCTLSRKLFPFHRSHSLEECCKRHRITNAQAHRAVSDARASAELLIYLLAACSSRYPRLEDLLKVASVER